LRIGVTGALGFTGIHFTRWATAAGHSVAPVQSDLTDSKALDQELADLCNSAPLDAVVHLAAISHVTHADLDAFYRVNVVGTAYLLDALLKAGQHCNVLLASSANVYGNAEQSPIAETQAPSPANHYAVSKLAMEYVARIYQDRLPLLVVRPFNYTGPLHHESFLIPKLVKHFVERQATVSLGNTHVLREFNDVRMVCASYLALLTSGTPGEIYNICTGKVYSLDEVLATLAHLTGHPIEVQINPAFVRANEIHRLCGNPDKLVATIGLGQTFEIAQTLQWMLDEALQASATVTPSST
jgi:GDP-6-deoxy-D-talose 4-dehydrogenase